MAANTQVVDMDIDEEDAEEGQSDINRSKYRLKRRLVDEEDVGADFFIGPSSKFAQSLHPQSCTSSSISGESSISTHLHSVSAKNSRLLPLVQGMQSVRLPAQVLMPTHHHLGSGSLMSLHNNAIQLQHPLGTTVRSALPQPVTLSLNANKMPIPDGSGNLRYPAPNPSSFTWDPSTGYRFDPSTGLHFDANSRLFYNRELKISLRWEPTEQTYLSVDSAIGASVVSLIQQNASRPVLSSATPNGVHSVPSVQQNAPRPELISATPNGAYSVPSTTVVENANLEAPTATANEVKNRSSNTVVKGGVKFQFMSGHKKQTKSPIVSLGSTRWDETPEGIRRKQRETEGSGNDEIKSQGSSEKHGDRPSDSRSSTGWGERPDDIRKKQLETEGNENSESESQGSSESYRDRRSESRSKSKTPTVVKKRCRMKRIWSHEGWKNCERRRSLSRAEKGNNERKRRGSRDERSCDSHEEELLVQNSHSNQNPTSIRSFPSPVRRRSPMRRPSPIRRPSPRRRSSSPRRGTSPVRRPSPKRLSPWQPSPRRIPFRKRSPLKKVSWVPKTGLPSASRRLKQHSVIENLDQRQKQMGASKERPDDSVRPVLVADYSDSGDELTDSAVVAVDSMYDDPIEELLGGDDSETGD